MIVYVVFKEGIYRHECGGIFSTNERAEAAARTFADGERDNWHEFTVVPFELDVQTPRGPESKWSEGPIMEPTATFRVSSALKRGEWLERKRAAEARNAPAKAGLN